METITFYSYKGGVGRSLTLSNIATYLSKFGFNVCVIDFDLEAPGLHYKFGLDSEKVDKGILDYIAQYNETDRMPNSILDYACDIDSKNTGKISLIPAGDVRKAAYWKNLAAINWNRLLYSEDKQGILFFLELKEQIKNEIKPDFLLIDSRTGITEIGGISTSLLADKVVFLLTHNQENIEGTLQVLNSVINAERLPKQKKIKPYFALTRIPILNEDTENREHEILEKLKVKFSKAFKKKNLDDDIFVIHSNRDLEIAEFLAVETHSVSTQYATLLNDYLRLFSHIINPDIIVPKLDDVIGSVMANMLSEPDETQIELENIATNYPHAKTLEGLLRYYILRNESLKKYVHKFEILNGLADSIPQDILTKYFDFFIEHRKTTEIDIQLFNLKIIENNIANINNPDLQNKVRITVGILHFNNSDYERAEQFFLLALSHNVGENIIYPLMKIYLFTANYNSGNKLYNNYKDVVDNTYMIKNSYLNLLNKAGKLDEMENILKDDKFENYLFERHINDVYEIFNKLGRDDEFIAKLSPTIDRMKSKRSFGRHRRLPDIVKVYDKLGKIEELEEKLKDDPQSLRIIQEIKTEKLLTNRKGF